MSGWTPPKLGSPVWIDISSSDLPRGEYIFLSRPIGKFH